MSTLAKNKHSNELIFYTCLDFVRKNKSNIPQQIKYTIDLLFLLSEKLFKNLQSKTEKIFEAKSFKSD